MVVFLLGTNWQQQFLSFWPYAGGRRRPGPGSKAWTCTGEDRIEARGAPANCTVMNVIRRIPSRRPGKDYQRSRRLAIESRMRLIRSWVPDLEKIRQTGKGLIAHGSGNRTCMGERINSVHGSLIPCHMFYDINEKVRGSV